MTFGSPVQPPEAYTWRGGEHAERRTTSNPAAATEGLVLPSAARVPTPDGEQIPVLVLAPPEPDGSAVLVIHGGPEAASVRNWSPVAAALTLAGHTVVLPNVRGSSGYGRRWLSLDDVDKRLDSVADLVAVRDWLPSIGVDPGRVALYGGSYGGYMVLAGLTFYPELWAAGVDIVGISSLVTFLQNTSAYRRAYREREYGRLDADREVLEAASPLPRIDADPRPAAGDPRRQRPAGAAVGGRAGGGRGARQRRRVPAAGLSRTRGTAWPSGPTSSTPTRRCWTSWPASSG